MNIARINVPATTPFEGLRVDHVGIVVRSLAGSRPFFESVLGLQLEEELDLWDSMGVRVAFFRSGDVALELIEAREGQERAQSLGDAEARIEHLCFAVEDIEHTASKLAEHGVRWTTEAPTEASGRRVLFSEAPSSGGLICQLMERVPPPA